MRLPTYAERVAAERRRARLWLVLRLLSLAGGVVLGAVFGGCCAPASPHEPTVTFTETTVTFTESNDSRGEFPREHHITTSTRTP